MESRRHRSGGGALVVPVQGDLEVKKGEARLPAACCESVSKHGGGGSCARLWVG